jgi:hypothetical protein
VRDGQLEVSRREGERDEAGHEGVGSGCGWWVGRMGGECRR